MMKRTRPTVYLLCAAQSIRELCPGMAIAHAKHYLGSTSRSLSERLTEHREGRGARLPQVWHILGITFILARTWEGGRSEERILKRQKNSPRLCPFCGGRKSREAPRKLSGGRLRGAVDGSVQPFVGRRGSGRTACAVVQAKRLQACDA